MYTETSKEKNEREKEREIKRDNMTEGETYNERE